MEEPGESEQKSLVNELTQGRQLAKQLQAYYLNVPSSSSNETPKFLVQRIQASYEKALSMLNYNNKITPFTAGEDPQHSAQEIRMSETTESQPLSRTRSSQNVDSDRAFNEHDDQLKNILPRWTQRVRVRPATALEGPLGDGFSWRKYGQKDILGAKYPREYYRCAHRNTQGCLATKLVQRSDDDPTTFEITYRGSHTCNIACNAMLHTTPSENQARGTNVEPQQHNRQLEENQKQQPRDLLLSFQRRLKVVTEDSEIGDPQTYPSSASDIKADNKVVSSAPSVVGNLSLMSSPNQSWMNDGTTVAATVESQVTEIIQAAAASTSADFPFGNDGFDPNFTFDSHRSFP